MTEINGKMKTHHEIRKQLYENIIDEVMFIGRASEGGISVDWVMSQPIFIRKKYVESLKKELEERERKLNSSKSKK